MNGWDCNRDSDEKEGDTHAQGSREEKRIGNLNGFSYRIRHGRALSKRYSLLDLDLDSNLEYSLVLCVVQRVIIVPP